jgi:2-phosphoglycerate kinase
MLPDPVNSAFQEAQNIVSSKVLQINPVYSAFQEAQNRIASTVSQIVEDGVIESQQEITKWGFIITSLIAVMGSAGSIALYVNYFTEESQHTKTSMSKIMTKKSAASFEDYFIEILTRNYLFFGLNAQDTIRKSYIIIVGQGGVGSHATACLVRSGISNIKIIDFDQVSTSS